LTCGIFQNLNAKVYLFTDKKGKVMSGQSGHFLLMEVIVPSGIPGGVHNPGKMAGYGE